MMMILCYNTITVAILVDHRIQVDDIICSTKLAPLGTIFLKQPLAGGGGLVLY